MAWTFSRLAGGAALLILALLCHGCRSSPPQSRVSDDDVIPILAGPVTSVRATLAPARKPAPPEPVVANVEPEKPAPAPKPKRAAKPKPVPEPEATPEPAPTAAPPASPEAPIANLPIVADSYQVQPGDSLKIEVFQEPDISRVFKISESGTINHPLLGRVAIAGLTLDAVESRLHELLAQDYLVNPKVMVTLERWAERPVIIFGEVRNPGVYDVPPGEKLTLLQLIARAGGFTDIAARDKLRIVRTKGEDEETIRVRVSELMKSGDRKDVELQPGDFINVPRTIF